MRTCLSDSFSRESVIGEWSSFHGAAGEVEEEPVRDAAPVQAVGELEQVAGEVPVADTPEGAQQPRP
jgi:hypothetical protein